MTAKQILPIISDDIVVNKIYEIRNQKVMLDRDLAELYGVETRVLNQAVKRNINRFPEDFMFEMNKKEFANWRSQIVTSIIALIPPTLQINPLWRPVFYLLRPLGNKHAMIS